MKRIGLFGIILSFSIFISGQEGQPEVFNYNYLDELANLNPGNPSIRGFDNRYEGLQGTPFAWKDWKPANLLLVENTIFSPEIEANIDLADQHLYFRLKTGIIGKLAAEKVTAVRFGREGEEEIIFKVFPETKIKGGKKDDYVFYQVLHEAPFTLLKETSKIFRKADYEGAYSEDRRYDEYLEKNYYWLEVEPEQFSKIKLNKKALVKALPDQATDIKRLWKQDDDESAVIDVLNKLVPQTPKGN